MREEMRRGNGRGIVLSSVTFGEKVLSVVLACAVAALLIVVPNIL
jgi:hypothetical protein